MYSIDIIVPTYNRPKDLEKFVGEIEKQKYPHLKVFIVDDHGDIDIEHLIPKNEIFEFIRLGKNIGQAGARNVAIERSEGDIIVSLDDDAWFLNDPNALERTVDYFTRFPKMGCLMYNIIEPEKAYLSTLKGLKDGDEIGFHITCGCAYKRKAIEEINGFSNFFHSGAEESDISFKLIKKGYSLNFAESIKVFHNFNPLVRNDSWYIKYRKNTTRNDLLIVVMYYPLLFVIPYFFGKWISHIIFSLFKKRSRWKVTFYTIYAGLEAFGKIPISIANRNPLSLNEFRAWLKIR